VYLAESVRTFQSPEAMASRLEETGFRSVRFKRLTGGGVALYFGEK
jgi:ubiquinone/menaquinone biosynthesis C-methylase UbiE